MRPPTYGARLARDLTRSGRFHASVLRLLLAGGLTGSLVLVAEGTAAQSAGASSPPATTSDWSNTPAVVIGLQEYQFVPDRIVLHAGRAYRLQLENRGKEIHDFTAPEFFAAVRLDAPKGTEGPVANIVLKPHERQELRLTAIRAGSYALRCADHDWAGMTATIVIE